MNRINAYKATELQRLARRIKLAGYCKELGRDELSSILLELFDEDRRRGDANVLSALAEVKGVAPSPAIRVDKSGDSAAAMLAGPLRGLPHQHESRNRRELRLPVSRRGSRGPRGDAGDSPRRASPGDS
ncbi:hypothetical protein QKT49_gp001 [Acanthamoeba castellanii medusavirus]|uniref:Uncharacterized protein n=1 Tax=Acanthamoeba castellanii medusavirus J1 TaxID=3114988 RepID=A0A3T1CWD2_9VIRU|nr:hypothetical protein QKT49_gp001 [Acanthamoeba castellanii medusavirus]BBI30141.1 hypothetical protein [Acanthamoeba castellanii medusavirus J1]